MRAFCRTVSGGVRRTAVVGILAGACWGCGSRRVSALRENAPEEIPSWPQRWEAFGGRVLIAPQRSRNVREFNCQLFYGFYRPVADQQSAQVWEVVQPLPPPGSSSGGKHLFHEGRWVYAKTLWGPKLAAARQAQVEIGEEVVTLSTDQAGYITAFRVAAADPDYKTCRLEGAFWYHDRIDGEEVNKVIPFRGDVLEIGRHYNLLYRNELSK